MMSSGGMSAQYRSASAEWLARLADRIEQGRPIKPCPKALRRIANLLETYDRKALAEFDAQPKRSALVEFVIQDDSP
jgi:hypothetical protein